ncbi:permease [Desulfosarcina cetonica]|uniref:permease n=1 Tax=Desulfosarcina cetonica TaxID=90730 RepID=UPI00155D9343|nr:permease [Desulfosarcina cetonica]
MLSYGVASVSGSVLAVCSCTVLPLFAGIWKRGAGLGPAIAFLYSGPAINVLAIILTARILGPDIGVARAVGAVIFSVVIGLFMHLLFRKEETAKPPRPCTCPRPRWNVPCGRLPSCSPPWSGCWSPPPGGARSRPAASGRPCSPSNGGWPVGSPSCWGC